MPRPDRPAPDCGAGSEAGRSGSSALQLVGRASPGGSRSPGGPGLQSEPVRVEGLLRSRGPGLIEIWPYAQIRPPRWSRSELSIRQYCIRRENPNGHRPAVSVPPKRKKSPVFLVTGSNVVRTGAGITSKWRWQAHRWAERPIGRTRSAFKRYNNPASREVSSGPGRKSRL